LTVPLSCSMAKIASEETPPKNELLIISYYPFSRILYNWELSCGTGDSSLSRFALGVPFSSRWIQFLFCRGTENRPLSPRTARAQKRVFHINCWANSRYYTNLPN
jgi:hypothetical protein